MSKVIKQMQMDALKHDFKDVREMVLLNIVGLDAIAENQIRLALRKKGIRLQLVKNSLARRVFKDLGLNVLADKDAIVEKKKWTGSTTIAWGASSAADLAKEVETIVKKNDKKMKVKTGVADGQQVTFDLMLKMPTRAEALGRVAMLALAPASRVAAQIVGPASQVCGQIKGIKDMKKDEGPVGEAAAAPSA